MLRENNCVYVDKTEIAHRLDTHSWTCFFSISSSTFGKSLFIDNSQGDF
ncbi:AAA family ATPase [Cylindrospermopsis raciborskii]